MVTTEKTENASVLRVMFMCMQDWKHHVLQLQRLAKHLHQLNQTVIWVDINPMTYAVHGAPALKCALTINAAAHEQVTQLA